MIIARDVIEKYGSSRWKRELRAGNIESKDLVGDSPTGHRHLDAIAAFPHGTRNPPVARPVPERFSALTDPSVAPEVFDEVFDSLGSWTGRSEKLERARVLAGNVNLPERHLDTASGRFPGTFMASPAYTAAAFSNPQILESHQHDLSDAASPPEYERPMRAIPSDHPGAKNQLELTLRTGRLPVDRSGLQRGTTSVKVPSSTVHGGVRIKADPTAIDGYPEMGLAGRGAGAPGRTINDYLPSHAQVAAAAGEGAAGMGARATEESLARWGRRGAIAAGGALTVGAALAALHAHRKQQEKGQEEQPPAGAPA
jgi:hypothetical protein